MIPSPRIASLLDMLQIHAHSFARATYHLALVRGMITGCAMGANTDLKRQKLSRDDQIARDHLVDLCTEAKKLDARLALITLERIVQLIDDDDCTMDAFTILIEEAERRLYDELSLRKVFSLDPQNADLFESAGFGSEVATKFPSAAYDIDEAGKCLALGRSTACVFHLMRVVETAVRAMHKCLGINTELTGNNKNWGSIANGIRDNIKSRGSSFPERDLFQELYATLDAVKDSWRNCTMHVDSKKTTEEAEMILLTSRNFMKKVASRMDENGLPLA